MKRYMMLNEEFFDDVETEEVTDTEIENEPFEETVPDELDELITLRFGISVTNLKIVADTIKKIDPYIRYALNAWNGLKYHEKFEYIYGNVYEQDSNGPEIIKENGITFKCYTNRYKRGTNFSINIHCKFNTNSPVNVYNVIGYMFNRIYKKANVPENTIQIISFMNDEREGAKIDKMIYNFPMSNSMKARYIGEVMKVVVGIDGSLGKVFKYLKENPVHILFNNLTAHQDYLLKDKSGKPKDTIVKFAENLLMSELLTSLPNNPKMFEDLLIFEVINGIHRKYSFHAQSSRYDSIWNNPEYKDLYNDINYFLKEKNLKFDVYLRKPWDDGHIHLYVCPCSTMVTDYFVVNYKEPIYDYDADKDYFYETEIGVAFECEPVSMNIFRNDDIYNKNNVPMFKLMMKLGNMTFDEVIDIFKKNFFY